MIAELKIYEDCSSKEPTKTYPVYQVTTKVSKRIADFQDKYDKNMSMEEATKELNYMFKSIFPTITDEELECTSIENQMEFVWAIVNHFNKVASKN